jgi:hypothetical protein
MRLPDSPFRSLHFFVHGVGNMLGAAVADAVSAGRAKRQRRVLDQVVLRMGVGEDIGGSERSMAELAKEAGRLEREGPALDGNAAVCLAIRSASDGKSRP